MKATIWGIAVLWLCGLSGTAIAGDWNGMWDGSGHFMDNARTSVICENISVATGIEQGTFELWWKGQCDTEAWEESLNFEIRNEHELWLDGEKVGTLTENVIEYTLHQPIEDYTYHVVMAVKPDGNLSIRDDVKQHLYESHLDSILRPLVSDPAKLP
jgi:hypothetical protein